ncbi:MAG: SMC-Scp complex subunit ScpB [Candidatus Atribacteria bacterium]|nr:MAG: SMC-Scp complex subunit ScpB [Candidatus Atribacteria bacterium]
MTTHGHPRNDLALAEAALFLAPQPLTRRALAKILGGVAQAYVDQLLEDLKAQFDDSNRGIELHIEDGRAMFRVKAVYVNEVAHLAPQHDIPRQELRTLAVIAYNNPMTQSNLIKIRGNKAYKHVQELIERNLITAEPQGRSLLLRVTRDFLRHFGLSSVEEFRFHFPTAAQENEEALARGTRPDDLEASQGDSHEADQNAAGSDIPSGEVSAEPLHQEEAESQDSAVIAEHDFGDTGNDESKAGEETLPPSIENDDTKDHSEDTARDEPSEEV